MKSEDVIRQQLEFCKSTADDDNDHDQGFISVLELVLK